MKRIFLTCAILLTAAGARADTGMPPSDLDVPYRHIASAFARLDPTSLRGVFADDAVLLFFEAGAPPALTIGNAAIYQRLSGTLDRLKKANKQARITVRLTTRKSDKDVAYDTGFYRLVVRDEAGKEETEYGSMMLELRRGADHVWRHRVDANGPATREQFEEAGKAGVYD